MIVVARLEVEGSSSLCRLTGLANRHLQPRFDLKARPEVRVVSALQDRD
jgi:hypothetical protein